MKKIENIQTANDAFYSTVKEAAESLKMNSQTIRDYLGKGIFTTYKFKTLTLINKQEIESWNRQREAA
jgi:excisionase family DNA binding protein